MNSIFALILAVAALGLILPERRRSKRVRCFASRDCELFLGIKPGKTSPDDTYDPFGFFCYSADYPLGTILRVSLEKSFIYVKVVNNEPDEVLENLGVKILLSKTAYRSLAPYHTAPLEVEVNPLSPVKKP